MTMQTTTLPFQVSGANALTQQPQRNAAAGVQASESNGFGATLSREIAQRQAAPAANAAPAPAPAANRPASQNTQAKAADKPAAQGPKAAAREPAKQNEAASDAPATAQAAGANGSAESAEGAEEAAESASAAAAAASDPVTDMLAFMASLAQPAQAAAPAATAAVAAATPAAAAGDGAELQLAALQSAFAKLDGADAAATSADPALASASEGEAGAGFSLAAGVQPTAGETADLRAAQQGAQNAVPTDAGKLQAQVRDTALQAEAPVEAAPAPSAVQLQAQAAKLDALNPAAVPGDRIPARVGTQAWDNQIGNRVVYMIGKEQAATLTLNPPDLGPVQIVLNVSNDQASVAFSSNQMEVRQALENALPRLRDMMNESGIALGNATVDAGVADGRQAQQDGERRPQGSSRGGNGVDNGTVAANDNVRTVSRTVATGDRGAVDIFA
ncbi:flagellar hook-length control protein FliK [uncultured Massilia sp.]|uniref:flagellar hook-length control protein FliK n=1 Tax=uncultured Massilia sp. TaxID=169973 RepID=UPI00258898C3|nr:flagellar hook-length control protein FliK [uncultured Massilia sp.]